MSHQHERAPVIPMQGEDEVDHLAAGGGIENVLASMMVATKEALTGAQLPVPPASVMIALDPVVRPCPAAVTIAGFALETAVTVR